MTRRSPHCEPAPRAPIPGPWSDRQRPLPPEPSAPLPRSDQPAKGYRPRARYHRASQSRGRSGDASPRPPPPPPLPRRRRGPTAPTGSRSTGGRYRTSPRSSETRPRPAPLLRSEPPPPPSRPRHRREPSRDASSRSDGHPPSSDPRRSAKPSGTRRRRKTRRRLESAMETKRRYEHPTPAAGAAPAAVSPERALRVFTQPERNPGIPLDLDLVRALRINRSAVERRAATIPTRRTVKKEWQAAWLLRAITCIDLTTLQGDDTPTNVLRLCAKAKSPVRPDLLGALGAAGLDVTVGAVCVYHAFVPLAVAALEGSGIPVAAVSTGFPAGLNPLPQRIEEIKASVAAGAQEIDVVITRALALAGAWEALYDEVGAFREACGGAHMKVILGTGDLATLVNVARASQVAMMAGADFIKTSTGKESVNATLPVGVVMTRQIRDYHERTGYAVGFKPAGGIRKAKQALDWLILMKEELGDRWLRANLFRLGASALLTDIERQLEHFVTGRYSAAHHHPMV